MLWSEAAGETAASRSMTDNSHYTAHPNSTIVRGRFGERIYSSIRRFVIIRVNRAQHFVEAWYVMSSTMEDTQFLTELSAITTYNNRGVLKPGCNPSEHTIVYSQGYQPKYIAGEYERGMTKTPIEVALGEPGEYMTPKSRLRFGKSYTIECNVKVRDMGMVIPAHRTMLLRYYQAERDNGFEPDEYGDDDDGDEEDDEDEDDGAVYTQGQ